MLGGEKDRVRNWTSEREGELQTFGAGMEVR